jgi:hypothetical protein
MKTINSEKVKMIVAEANDALAAIAKKHGLVKFKSVGSIRVEGDRNQITGFAIKLEAIVDDDKMARELTLLGLPEGSIGREIDYDRKRFRITGANLSKPKFGVAAIDIASGKTYNLVTAAVIKILSAS